MINMDIIDKKNISSFDIKKNYIFSENGNLYFFEKLCNIIFIADKELKEISIDPKIYFQNYIEELIEICKNARTHPSIIFLGENKYKSKSKILNTQNIDLINQPSSLLSIEDEKEIDQILKKIILERSNIQNFLNGNEVFIIIENIEKINLSSFISHLIVAKSRKIYFIILYNKTYSSDNLNLQYLLSNCAIKILYNNNGLEKIIDRDSNIIKEFKH